MVQQELQKNEIYNTETFSPSYDRIIPGLVFESDEKAFLQKKFMNKNFIVLLENDSDFFKKTYFPLKLNKFSTFSISELEKNNDKISTIIFYVTERCNLRCPSCFSYGSYEKGLETDIAIEKIREVINKVKNKYIVLNGGEPTLREDLFDIIEAIVKSRNIPILFTNGIKLTDLNYVRKLKKVGLNCIHFSLNGFSNDIDKKINGKSLVKVRLKALKNIRKVDIKVLLSMNIIKNINEKEIIKVINFALKNNDIIKGVFIRPNLQEGRVEVNSSQITNSDIIKLIEGQTKSFITKDHFIEYKKFRWNIFKVIKNLISPKLANKFSLNVGFVIMLKKKSNKLAIYPQLETLKKINKIFECDKKKTKILINLIKSTPYLFKLAFQEITFKLVLSLLKNKFDTTSVADNLLNFRDITRIWVENIQTSLNRDLLNSSRTYTFNNNDLLKPITNSWATGPE